MINIADLPAVRAQLERDIAAAKDGPASAENSAAVEYARAPAGPAAQSSAGRPPATQWGTR
jgi:hypothetical protein